jgi:hypothetical protein
VPTALMPTTWVKSLMPNASLSLPYAHALEMQPDQIAHRELAVSGRIDHVLEARG